MTLLGAILAGGQSSRFGSDKAAALLHGLPLIDHVARALAGQCDAVVVVGHDHAHLPRIDDHPCPGHGPLGGINAALRHAHANGFDRVLSAPCDAVNLDAQLAKLLQPGPSFVASQPVIGLWPVSAAAALDAMLAEQDGPAVMAFADRIGACAVTLCNSPANINSRADLTRWKQQHGI